MESWKNTWHSAIAPMMSLKGLEALWEALINDDDSLLQGACCNPPPITSLYSCYVEGGCLICYPFWKGQEVPEEVTIEEVDQWFGQACSRIEKRVGSNALRCFLNWYDDMPREEVRRQLLPEVHRSLIQRKDNIQKIQQMHQLATEKHCEIEVTV